MKNKKKNFALFFGCMAAVFFIMIGFSFQKKGTFVDEMLTYDLSNRESDRVGFMVSFLQESSLQEIIHTVQDVREKGWSNSLIYSDFKAAESANAEKSVWHSPEYFSKSLTADYGHRFDFLSVMYNSSYDSAPPLYYLFIHLISSLFPGTFSLWIGLAVNILFLLLTCALLYGITARYFSNCRLMQGHCQGYAVLVTFCYLMSVGSLSTLFIIRMYAIYTFFILAFLIGVVMLHLFHRKETRPLLKPYFAASLAAGVISLVIWPFSVKNIFFDSFGQGTLSHAVSGNYFFKIYEYLRIIVYSLFVNWEVFAGVLVLGMTILLLFFRCKRKGISPYATRLSLPPAHLLSVTGILCVFSRFSYCACIILPENCSPVLQNTTLLYSAPQGRV